MSGGVGASQSGAANPWLINEPEETRGLSFGEIKQQQQRIIEGNYTWWNNSQNPDKLLFFSLLQYVPLHDCVKMFSSMLFRSIL